MKCVVFVPGIMGSELTLAGEKIWPPSMWGVVFGFNKMAELMSDELAPSAVIRSVGVKPVYESILDDFKVCGYSRKGTQRRLIDFPYDWRRSNSDSAEKLADVLDDRLKDVDEWDLKITLIGHSMGGLVLRSLLESGHFENRSWFSRIGSLITLGTPHLGAPKALNQLRGTEGMLGVRPADLVKLASDVRFPSLYQLVASPHSALTLELMTGGALPISIDAFSAAVAEHLELKEANMTSATEFWSSIGIEKRPKHVPYYCIGGAAHKTIARMEWDAVELAPVERRQSGDGTVPFVSSIPKGIPHGISEKKHMSIFEDREIRKQLYRFLEAPAHVRPQAADAKNVGDPLAFGISIDKDEYRVGEPIELTFSYNKPMTDPNESIRIHAIDPLNGEVIQDSDPVGFSAQLKGGEVTGLAFTIHHEFVPGLYLIKPARDLDDPTSTVFIVSSEDINA